ncbi:MAG: hypothetical protein FJZ56_01410 [Chlamydiae bacterium]|nr:hypothetical protein [Chlamydiota bacterium]
MVYERTVRLKDTDATGFLYFTAQQDFVVEAIEEAFSIQELLQKEYALPIVMVKSIYKKPLRVNDTIFVHLKVEQTKEKSLTWKGVIKDEKHEYVGEVDITQVCIDRQTRLTIPLPEEVMEKINSFGIL